MYILLGVLYESYIHPVTILSTLPSAGVGALLSPCSSTRVLRHRVLIESPAHRHRRKERDHDIDFALDAERKEKAPPEEAIFRAAKLRFRPILMTTLADAFRGVPLALGSCIGRS